MSGECGWTFASDRPDEAFTMCIRLRRPYRRLQHLKRHRLNGLVHHRREDAIAIVDQEAIGASFTRSSAAIRSSPQVWLFRHLRDQLLHIGWNTRASPWTRLQAVEETKQISVPPHEGVGTHDRQELAPFDNAREEHGCNARRIVSPSRADPAFDVTRKLLAKEEVLRGQLPTGPDHEPQQAQQVSEEGERCSEHVG